MFLVRSRYLSILGRWCLPVILSLRDEAIPLASDRLNELRLLRIVPQRLANFVDCCIDPMLSVYEDIFSPEPVHDLLPGGHAAVLLDQQDEQFHGDAFQL